MEKKELFNKEMVLRYTERLLWNDYNLRSEKERQDEMEIGEQLRLIEDEILSLPEDEWCEAAKKLADQGVLVGFFLDACRASYYDNVLWSQLKNLAQELIEKNRDYVNAADWSDDEVLETAKNLLEPFNEAMASFHFMAAMGIEYGNLQPIFAELLKAWFKYRIENYDYGY